MKVIQIMMGIGWGMSNIMRKIKIINLLKLIGNRKKINR